MATFTGISSGGISLGGSLGNIVVHGQDWVTTSKNWGGVVEQAGRDDGF
jgi:hypothetical protein